MAGVHLGRFGSVFFHRRGGGGGRRASSGLFLIRLHRPVAFLRPGVSLLEPMECEEIARGGGHSTNTRGLQGGGGGRASLGGAGLHC